MKITRNTLVKDVDENQYKRLDSLEPEIQDLKDKDIALQGEIDTINEEILTKEYNLTSASGWNTNSTWGLPKAFKIGRVVYIQGFLTGGSENSVMIDNMPTELRPSKPMRFNIAAAGIQTLVQVNPDGKITCIGTNTTNIYLDGITYIK